MTPATLAAPPLARAPEEQPVERAYFSISEAAALLGVSRVTVWRWVSSGRLPVTRLGHRTVRVTAADLQRFLRLGVLENGHAREKGHAAPPPLTRPHLALFYEADDFAVHGVAEFLAPAFERGEDAVIVATRAHRESIEERLRLAGVDVSAAKAAGRLVALDAADTLKRFMVDGLPDADLFAELVASIVGQRRVRIFGEMVALLAAEANHEGALALEELWNQMQAKHRFELLCAYPIHQLGGDALASVFVDVCAAHSQVVPTESYTRLANPDERLRAVAALQQKAASLERALAAERAARGETQAAVGALEEFLSIASHELRTPITVISAQAQLSLRRLERTGQLEPERLGQALRTMGTQADKMGRLVSQLLDTSRIDTGKLAIEPRPADLAHLVQQVVAATRLLSDQHTISLVAPASLECEFDAFRIEQVLTNLLDNAIKYSPHGGSIEVVVEQSTPSSVELSVRDHGLGIPADKSDQIFERFFQAHGAGRWSGMGLGLYVCRHIVDLHGGQIRAESPEDGGTRFVVRLPASRSASVRSSVAAD